MPRLGVRATVVPVGVTDGGDLAVPGDARRVGWYRFGGVPAPDGGSTVLVGHVDSRSRGLGALAALRSVRRGDRVGIRLSGGDREHYRVTARRSVAKERFPARVFRRSGPSALTLVTCTGPFLPERGGYQRILLVTAVPAAAP
ncbi:class F sortase [Streptomyces sp. JJ36]|nr:class F sortase [Streptomyces sp. JJ36]